ncbi:MAG: S8 family serine peptidase [bacterium]|nr:S8 family serine peptidase [bacterium]
MRHTRFSLVLVLALTIVCALPSALMAEQLGAVSNQIDHRRAQLGALPNVPSPSGFYIVELNDAPLASYDGSVKGYAATQPRLRGEHKLQASSPESQAYLGYLAGKRAAFLMKAEQRLGRAPEVLYEYTAVTNGVVIRLDFNELENVAAIPEVRRILSDRILPLHTDRGPTWIGAPTIWDGSQTGGLPGTYGEGIIVGGIDTGINMDHPSFAATDGEGYVHTNPFGAGVYVGWCDPANPNYDPSYLCNDKLIGGWDYIDAYCAANPATCTETDGPGDEHGHGSHTASTSAGNKLLSPEISGVAPRANIISYDVCYTNAAGNGLCPFVATSAAVDQAVLDGVDVTNYSIGGGSGPWGGDIDTYFLEAFAAGIYSTASAGNSGPGAATVAHLGPWMSTTGASTHDRVKVANELVSMSGGISPPADMEGASRTAGYGPETVVYAGDFSNGDPNPEQCLNPFPASTWTSGEIVLCDRGAIDNILKCANIQAGGAGGCILANVTGGNNSTSPDPHVIPAIHVDLADGDTLRTWLAGGSGHTATITAASVEINPAVADIMASFSSIGPNEGFSVLKPDLTAPGVAIFAALSDDPALPPNPFGKMNGTSMSSPHNAGSGALLSALKPSWSPAEIKSTLMLSADTTVKKPNGTTDADPFDFGGGRIDLTKAARVGLVLDETYTNMLAADPLQGGSPETLNLASMQENACVEDCTFTRTFTNQLIASTDWTISFTTPPGVTMSANPTGFTLATVGTTQAVDFTIDVSSQPLGTWVFAEVTLTPNDGSPTLHMPVAVLPGTVKIPSFMSFETKKPTGDGTVPGIEFADPVTDLTVDVSGLVRGTQNVRSINEDPTNGNAYDDLSQVFWTTFSVPAGATRASVVTSSDESPDVDLFVGTGATPSGATQVCASATAGSDERCDILTPATGTWWMLVQNYEGSSNQPDDVLVTHAVVPNTDAGNLTATGPATVAASTAFDLDLDWNVTPLVGDEIWFGTIDVGTDPGNHGNIGAIMIDITTPNGFIFADDFESGDVTLWSSSKP